MYIPHFVYLLNVLAFSTFWLFLSFLRMNNSLISLTQNTVLIQKLGSSFQCINTAIFIERQDFLEVYPPYLPGRTSALCPEVVEEGVGAASPSLDPPALQHSL